MVVRAPDHRLLTPRDLLTYRLLAIVGAVCVIGFGLVYPRVMSVVVDPWSLRIGVGALCLGVAVLTWVRDQRWLHRALTVLFYVITGWVALLLHFNQFAAEYALGFFLVVAVICGIMRSAAALVVYAAVTIAEVAVVGTLAPAPRVSPMLFLVHLGAIFVLFSAALRNRLRAADELAESESRYALAAHGANDGLWDWDLLRGTLYLSTRWKEIIGHREHELSGRPAEWLERIHPDDRRRVQAALFAGGHDGLFECEYRIAHRDGTERWVLVRGTRVVDATGIVVRLAGSQTDITERKQAEAQLAHGALHDRITGLPNRVLFLDRLDRALAYARREPGFRFAVLTFDIDRFRLLNDRLGHNVADVLLGLVGARIERTLRANDTVARLGHDEFAVLLHGLTDDEDPVAAAGRLQGELAEPFEVDGQQVSLTTSCGIALSCTGFDRPEEVMRDADAAMERAKQRGRGQLAVVDTALHEASEERSRVEHELAAALDAGQFRLHFQPVVVMQSEQIVGFEALVRWEHPERGLQAPDTFIPLAEETGMIVPIGRWVLEEGCWQMMAWRAADPRNQALWLSVNLSSRQFLSPDLVRDIHEILARTGFPADRLRLEMTESVFIDNPSGVAAVLQRLRDKGIRVAIDDFGTGYSSLAYLHHLPVDTLKIDRSFVRDMHNDPTLGAVVQTVIALSGRLRLDTVAEGVETDADMAALRRMGCQLGQGYLFSRPVAADAATALLAHARAGRRISGAMAAVG